MKVYPWTLFGITIFMLAAVNQLMLSLNTDQPQVVKRVMTKHKVVALTIDDGPHVQTTPELLDVLRRKQVHVTFFVLGVNAEKSLELVTQAAADGHEIATHGYSHHLMTKMSEQDMRAEFDKNEQILHNANVVKPVLFRPPGGAYHDQVLNVASDYGYTTILWSVDPHDWKCPPVQEVVDNVMNNVKPGAIVLLHDGQYPLPTPQAVALIIDQLRAKGYSLVTVSELLRCDEEN